ncbi:hypothetical protein HMI56_004496 [Coelomomyces lativittatus]|nr:hypothetical protein HMI56_004496 [Coelomomyces lativittatus]
MHVAKSSFTYTSTLPQIKPWLKSLIDVLEWEKKQLRDEETVMNDIIAQAHLENFALQIFSIADDEDQAGRATVRTAKIFLAASHYLEVLVSVFPKEEMNDVKEKIKYAKWKATSILKHPPLPPSPVSSTSTPSSFPSMPTSFEPSSSSTQPAVPPTEPNVVAPMSSSTWLTSEPPSMATSTSSKYDPSVLTDAQKQARFGINALDYEDIPTALSHFEKAIALLSPYRTSTTTS